MFSKIKVRYKILLINLLFSLIYYIAYQAYFLLKNFSNDFHGIMEHIMAAVVLSYIYFYTAFIWLLVILWGFIKKKKELTIGGLLALMLPLLFLLYSNIQS